MNTDATDFETDTVATDDVVIDDAAGTADAVIDDDNAVHNDDISDDVVIDIDDNAGTDDTSGDDSADDIAADDPPVTSIDPDDLFSPAPEGMGAMPIGASAMADPDLADESAVAVMTEDDLFADVIATPKADAVSPYDKPGKWFVVHTQSGYEKRVKSNIEARIASMDMEGKIHEIVIPMRDVPEFKNGKKVITSKRLFPGYVFVRCDLDDNVWPVIRDTPNVSGFVTRSGKPSPLGRRDVENYLGTETDESQESATRAKPMFEYGIGDTVRVKDGPFADFAGEIVEINEDQLKVKVLVNIFGRETPTEVGFAQVARL